jgi:hypothetical protein
MDNDPPPLRPAPRDAPVEAGGVPMTRPREGDADSAAEEAGTVTADPFIGPRGSARRGLESSLVRVVATCGIIGIAVALAAILGTQDIAPWVIGLVVSTLSVALAAILWSSRTL